MYLKIQEINTYIIERASRHFGKAYIQSLKKEKKSTYNESLVARYLIDTQKKKYNTHVFFSISHKENIVFIGIHGSPIGLDIERIKKRDQSLLGTMEQKEYDQLGGKSWINFYFLWTAKESIIKKNDLTLNQLNKIILKKAQEKSVNKSGIPFSKHMIFIYNHTEFQVYSHRENNILYSLV